MAELEGASSYGERFAGFVGIGTPMPLIKKALAEYERNARNRGPAAEDRQWKLLETIEEQCDKFLASNQGTEDKARHGVVSRLKAELPTEQIALAKRQAEAIYFRNLEGRTEDKHNLRFATDAAQKAGRGAQAGYAGEMSQLEAKPEPTEADTNLLERLRERMALVKAKGLTPAESAAITAYTAQDYEYMNRAASNSRGWMQTWLSKRGDTDAGAHEAARQEGSMQTAFARDGLRKLDPYVGFSYRGDPVSIEEFESRIVVGGSGTRPNLLSTSTEPETALGFGGDTTADRPIAVMWVFDQTKMDSGGRDVKMFSANAREAEILIIAGSPFKISSVVEVGSPGGERQAGKHVDYYRAILADAVMKRANTKKCYMAVAVGEPVNRAPAP